MVAVSASRRSWSLVAHVLARPAAPFNKINHLTPQFLVLFAFGVLAVATRPQRPSPAQRLAPGPLARIAGGRFVVFLGPVSRAPSWMVARYFWVDILFGARRRLPDRCHVRSVARGWPRAPRVADRAAAGAVLLQRLPGARPIVVVLPASTSSGRRPSRARGQFGLMLVIGVPVHPGVLLGFHLLFEAPFLRHRDMSALRDMPLVRIRLPRPRRSVALPDVVVPAGDEG